MDRAHCGAARALSRARGGACSCRASRGRRRSRRSATPRGSRPGPSARAPRTVALTEVYLETRFGDALADRGRPAGLRAPRPRHPRVQAATPRRARVSPGSRQVRESGVENETARRGLRARCRTDPCCASRETLRRRSCREWPSRAERRIRGPACPLRPRRAPAVAVAPASAATCSSQLEQVDLHSAALARPAVTARWMRPDRARARLGADGRPGAS